MAALKSKSSAKSESAKAEVLKAEQPATETSKSEQPSSKRASKSKIHASNISEEGTLKLSDAERFKLNWESAEMRAASNALRIKLMEYEMHLKKVDPTGLIKRYLSEISALTESHKSCERKFMESSRQIAQKFKMDPTHKWSYDDESGLIHMDREAEVKSNS